MGRWRDGEAEGNKDRRIIIQQPLMTRTLAQEPDMSTGRRSPRAAVDDSAGRTAGVIGLKSGRGADGGPMIAQLEQQPTKRLVPINQPSANCLDKPRA